MLVRIGALIAAFCCLQVGLLSASVAVPQSEQLKQDSVLDGGVVALIEEAMLSSHPAQFADRLWQASAAAHGEVDLLLAAMEDRVDRTKAPDALRLLCGILRYQGLPQRALRCLDQIPLSQRLDADQLLRAELLDALGRSGAAAEAYDRLLEAQLDPELRRRILFRRALVAEDSVAQLAAFAGSPELDREQRNQAAMILALRNEPAKALALYQVQGEGSDRFRQLIRLAEWALAAEDYPAAQEFGWEAVQVGKMKRDRRYALTVVVSAYRAGNAIDALLTRLEASTQLKDDARQVWIDLLRDEGRVDDALRLFRKGSSDNAEQWTPALRRQLLEICRETGREDVLVAQFRELMSAEPRNLEWRSGLSRYFLESGDRLQAKAAWADYGDGAVTADEQLQAAYALMELGLDELALRFANRAASSADLRETAQLFIVKLYVDRGRFDEASSMLSDIENRAEGKDPVLAEVAGIFERMDRLDRAVQVLSRMRKAYGGFLGTDLDMKYALLLSKVDRERDALAVWRSLWSKVRSTPRGRYVEDRMMTVAARLGVLAKIAIELEDKLDAGTADTTDVELLVRLYVKVGDSAAATEITEQSLQASDISDIEITRRKATIFLACQDYLEYENLIEQLIELDVENRLDHMRELTLSRLERGRRAQAIETLPLLRAAESDSGIADEFEAGIYQLAGLQEPALRSYVKGLGRFPDRIDTHLLVANLMRATGREMEAVRRFQYLASTAKRDDLFTIAIDGILNLRAQDDTQVPTSVVEWAMRVTLERLAERSHRFYLHRLAADLAEELGDMPMSIRTLTAGIPVAGERRTALLREILGKVRSLDKNARVLFGGSRRTQISKDWDPKPYVMIGRRLLGQGEIVPPQVYMDLAAIFLHVKAVPDAMRTFSRAAELLDRSVVHRQAAAVLEAADRYDAALKFYRRLLAVDANDVGLLVKVGRLEELAGRDDAARKVYEQGFAAAVRQTPPRVHLATIAESDPDDLSLILGRQRSVDALTAAMPDLIEGLLVTLPAAEARSFLDKLQQHTLADLERVSLASVQSESADSGAATIDQFPRLQLRAGALRRLCLCFRELQLSDVIDAQLLQRFPTDRELAKASIEYRTARGFHVSAARLVEGSEFRGDPKFAWLISDGEVDAAVPPAVAASRAISLLVTDPERLRSMLDSIDTAAIDKDSLPSLPLLLGACAVVGASDASERIARAGVRLSTSLSARERVAMSRNGDIMIQLAARLAPELRGRLERYRLERTAAKGAKALISLRYQLDEDEDHLLDSLRIEQMLRTEVANSAQEQFGLRSMGLLFFISPERRPVLVRELYTAAPSSQRLRVLAEGADFLMEPLTDVFVDWYATAFEREFAEKDKRERRSASFSYSLEGSQRLKQARLEVSMKLGGSHREWLRLLRVLAKNGDFDAANKLLDAGIPAMLSRDDLAGIVANRPKELNKGQLESAIREIQSLGLVDQAAAIVARKLKRAPRHEALRYAQWLLRAAMPGASEFVAERVQKSPQDLDVLERTFQFQKSRGRLVEAVDTLKRLVTLDEARAKRWRSRLATLHNSLGNSEAAAKLRVAGKGKVEDSVESAASSFTSMLMNILGSSGAAASPAVSAAESPKDDRQDGVGERLKLRRKWRGKQTSRPSYSSFLPRANISMSRKNLEALNGKDFAAGEVRRMLRLLEDAGQLDSGSLLAGLLQSLPAAADPVAAAEEYLQQLAGGQGGTAESVQLLMSLVSSDLPSDLREQIVSALLMRRDPPDQQRMRSLADELVRMKQSDAAAQLYRLGYLVGGRSNIGFRPKGAVETVAEVVKTVQSRLGGDLGRSVAIEMLDDQLAVAEEPGSMLAALQLWPVLLSPEQVEERVSALRAKLCKLRASRRASYTFNQKAGVLAGAFARALLQAGLLDLALEEVALLVCLPVPDAYGRSPSINERLVKKELEAIFKLEVARSDAWMKSCVARALEWHRGNQLRDPVTTLGFLGLQAGSSGHPDLALACADELKALGLDDSRAEQQLAYVLRAAGDLEGAWSTEKKLLMQRRLAVVDHPRVLAELHQRDGGAVAFAAGVAALKYTRTNEVLAFMAKFAEELGEAERAAEWRAVIAGRKTKKPSTKPSPLLKMKRR